MRLNPEEIFDKFTQNKLSKQIASELLIHLIEKSNDEDLRLENLKTLKKINLKISKIFIFLENLLISDSNQCLRIEAFNIIKEEFSVKAIKPIIHSINTEEDICIINFIDFLSEIDQIKCREIIINRLKKIDDINLCYHN